jgi:hypothetical protein
MSTSHNHRRKTIRKFKRKFGTAWRNHFSEHCTAIRRSMEGDFMGTAADLISPGVGGLAGEVTVSSPVST